jgi:tetratricopeptide (TPR) repeat protein
MISRTRSAAAARVRQNPAKVSVASPAARPWKWIWLLLSGLALTLFAFGPSLDAGFIFDDYHLPFADPHAGEMSARFWIGGVRPMLIATYWANFLISGAKPVPYHAFNLILHACTAVLVFFVFDRLLDLAGVKETRRWYALFGAALYLVHPLQTESVDYVAGRSEEVAGFFFFAAWLAFLKSFESETHFGTVAAVLVLAGAAVLGKESAISLPAVLIATDFYFAKNGLLPQLRRRLKLYIPFVLGAIAGAAFILRGLSSTSAVGASSGASPLSYALTQCRVIPLYIRLFLIPVGQNGDWQLPFFHSLGADGAWFYALLMAMLLAAVAWLYRRDRMTSFGLLFFLLTLAPTSSVIPIKDALAERRMYVPIAGLILTTLAVLLRARVNVNSPAVRFAGIAVLAAASVLSWRRSEVWQSEASFWRDAAQKNPANARAYYGLGVALTKQGDCLRAISAFETARAKDPKNPELLWDLATDYECIKKPELAVSLLRTFVAMRPGADAYDRIAYLEGTLGHVSPAMEAIDSALRLDPNDPTAYAYRGLAKIALNDPAGADADFRHALDLDPHNATATKGLATLAGQQ